MARRAYSGYCADGDKRLMEKSQTIADCLMKTVNLAASFRTSARPTRLRLPVSRPRRIFLTMAANSLAFVAVLGTGCSDEPAPKPAAEEPAKPAAPAVPEEMQDAATSLLGKETQVLVFGDLAKTGKQQFLAANVVPKTPKNNIPGTIVTRAVLAEETDGKWSELLRCDEIGR